MVLSHQMLGEQLRHSNLACSSTPNKYSGKHSCSPIQCNFNTDPDCAIDTPPPLIDHHALLAELTCKQCPAGQATHGACMRLADHLKVSLGHVTAAFCNDEFMVVQSDGLPHVHTMDNIPQPPTLPNSSTGQQCRVRALRDQMHIFKIPVNPTYLSNPAVSVIPNALPLAMAHNMPRAGAIGLAADGLAMATNYNENGLYQWTSCSLDMCNGRIEGRLDYKYHGDPFGPGCLYSESDYSGEHPPLIGWALDGFAIYGRYLEEGNFALGVHDWLDECGGHTHALAGFDADGAGTYTPTYHYHASVEIDIDGTLEGTAGGPFKFNAYKLAPSACFRGAINAIPSFWEASGERSNYDRRDADHNTSTPILSTANDFEQLRPCCGMQHYYVKSGYEINGAAANAPYPPYPPPIPLPPTNPWPPFPPPDLTDDLIGIGMASGAIVSCLICCAFCCYLNRRYDGTPEWRGGMDIDLRRQRKEAGDDGAAMEYRSSPTGPACAAGGGMVEMGPWAWHRDSGAPPHDVPIHPSRRRLGPPVYHRYPTRPPPIHEEWEEWEQQKLWGRDELARRDHEWRDWYVWEQWQQWRQKHPPRPRAWPLQRQQLHFPPRPHCSDSHVPPPPPHAHVPQVRQCNWHHAVSSTSHRQGVMVDEHWDRKQTPGHYRV